MPEPVVSFWVPGRAKTQGSKTAGLVRTRDGRVIPTMRESGGAEWRAWRSQVRDAAIAAFGDFRAPLDGPISIALTFFFVRPKGHFGTGCNSERLKADAPTHPWGCRDDIDKLARAVNDSLATVVFGDDGQIVSAYLAKRFGPTYGLQIQVFAEPEAVLALPDAKQLALL